MEVSFDNYQLLLVEVLGTIYNFFTFPHPPTLENVLLNQKLEVGLLN